MQLRVKKGSDGRIVRFVISTAPDGVGRPLSGLGRDTEGAQAYYIGEGEATPSAIVLQEDRLTPGGFREVDPKTVPGLYELHIPKDVFQVPGHSAVIMLRIPGALPTLIEIDLVEYDPYDSQRLGLECLSQEARFACLQTAFRDVVPGLVQECQEARPR